jgi:hypothetical protein
MSASYLVRFANGQTFGPADFESVAKWAHEGRLPYNAVLVNADGSGEMPVSKHPVLNSILTGGAAGPSGAAAAPAANDGVSTIIPYRNSHALFGYYTGVASLIPALGLIAGPAAIVLGILGLRHAKRHPEAKGKAHAWVAISLGTLSTLGHIGAIIAIVIAANT